MRVASTFLTSVPVSTVSLIASDSTETVSLVSVYLATERELMCALSLGLGFRPAIPGLSPLPFVRTF